MKAKFLPKDETKVEKGKTLWLTGYPTAGKTWLADFLEMYHNYIHVDGDEFVSLWTQDGKGNPAYQKACEGFWSMMMEYIFQGKEVPEGLGEPYYDLVINRYNEARKANPDANIVVCVVVYTKKMRDYLRSKIDSLKFMCIGMEKSEFAKRQGARDAKVFKEQGITLKEGWEQYGMDKEVGPYEEGAWDKYNQTCADSALNGFDPLGEDEGWYVESDFKLITSNVSKALGLEDIKEYDAEKVCAV